MWLVWKSPCYLDVDISGEGQWHWVLHNHLAHNFSLLEEGTQTVLISYANEWILYIICEMDSEMRPSIISLCFNQKILKLQECEGCMTFHDILFFICYTPWKVLLYHLFEDNSFIHIDQLEKSSIVVYVCNPNNQIIRAVGLHIWF